MSNVTPARGLEQLCLAFHYAAPFLDEAEQFRLAWLFAELRARKGLRPDARLQQIIKPARDEDGHRLPVEDADDD